jgi:hypothetical protein
MYHQPCLYVVHFIDVGLAIVPGNRVLSLHAVFAKVCVYSV